MLPSQFSWTSSRSKNAFLTGGCPPWVLPHCFARLNTMYVYSGPAPWSPAGWRFPWPEWIVLLTVLECWLVMQTITSKTLGLQPVLPHYKQGESTDFPSLNAVWNHLLPSHSLNVSTHVHPHNKQGEKCKILLFGHCFEIIFFQATCSKSP